MAEQIIAVLGGRPARWAVNAPQVGSDEMAVVVPYQDLALRMGSLWAQLGGGGVRRVELVYQGEVARVHPAAITAEALGGMLRHFSQDRVTAVNAVLVAHQHGIEVREQRNPEAAGLPSSLLLRVDGDGPREIEGTVTLGEPRIIRLDALHMDLQPVGSFLLLSHRDRPGLIGEVGQLLGNANVNIAEMQVGRDKPRGRAVTAVRVDESVPAPLAERLRQIEGVDSLHLIEL